MSELNAFASSDADNAGDALDELTRMKVRKIFLRKKKDSEEEQLGKKVYIFFPHIC